MQVPNIVGWEVSLLITEFSNCCQTGAHFKSFVAAVVLDLWGLNQDDFSGTVLTEWLQNPLFRVLSLIPQ